MIAAMVYVEQDQTEVETNRPFTYEEMMSRHSRSHALSIRDFEQVYQVKQSDFGCRKIVRLTKYCQNDSHRQH